MRLQEEYFKRHHLEDLLCVQHCMQGAVILRTVDKTIWKSRWLLVTIKWVEQSHHPGLYVIEFNSPVHDGEFKGKFFNKGPSTEIEWDNYEDFFLSWTKQLRGIIPVRGQKQIVMTAWEMFVYCYDGWFRKQSHEIKELLYKSLDEDVLLVNRYIGYQDIMIYLSTHHPGVVKAWKYEVLFQVQCYSDWLARLVENRCSTLQ